jgi:hypothetical protein
MNGDIHYFNRPIGCSIKVQYTIFVPVIKLLKLSIPATAIEGGWNHLILELTPEQD